MSEWKRQGKSGYLKMGIGQSVEGIYQGYSERENTFKGNNPNAPDVITDYKIEVEGEEKILSSTARTLNDQLKPLTAPCNIKIEYTQKGVKKWYVVWTQE